MYNPELFTADIGLRFQQNYSASHFNSAPNLTRGIPDAPGAEPGNTKPGFGRLLLAAQIEKTADFVASIGGYMVGYPLGFAFGVYTRTNPLATAHLGGALGSTAFPRIIKEAVT